MDHCFLGYHFPVGFVEGVDEVWFLCLLCSLYYVLKHFEGDEVDLLNFGFDDCLVVEWLFEVDESSLLRFGSIYFGWRGRRGGLERGVFECGGVGRGSEE
jgi:hypothetical protein